MFFPGYGVSAARLNATLLPVQTGCEALVMETADENDDNKR